MTMEAAIDDFEKPVTKRTVSAAKAAPIKTKGAPSVFALGDAAKAPDGTQHPDAPTAPTMPPAQRTRIFLDDAEIKEAIAAHGKLNQQQVTEIFGCGKSVAHRRLKRLVDAGEIVVAGHTASGASMFSLPQADADDLRCGLFNDGVLLIEADGQSMRLTKARVCKLVSYLDKIATALQAA